MYKHILIPVDGSAISNKAAKAGVALAKSLGAKVTIYSAIESMQPIYAEGYEFDEKCWMPSKPARTPPPKSMWMPSPG